MTTYKYGTIKGKAGCKRINPKTNDCEFILWAAGKKAAGNPKGQCLIIWRGNCKTPCQITMINRKDLVPYK
jgi:hypothetical protein